LSHPTPEPRTLFVLSARRLLITAILALHAGLLAWLAARHSPTIHEMAHLPAGICHWQFGMFELYRVNPPLPRMVAALPVLLCHPKTDWGNYQLDPLSRETTPMGIRFAKANGARTIFLFMIARWACIPFCLLGGWVCYRWACELWGFRAGLLALCLWCFNPMILGHGAVVMPDVPGAAMGVFAAWRFWKWLREPAWSTAALAGLALGLAELCKTTLLVFFILWPVAWLTYRRHHAPRDVDDALGGGRDKGSITRSVMPTVRRKWLRETLQIAAMFLIAIYVINLGYAFKGSCRCLGEYRFQSRLLSGQPTGDPPKAANRFTWGSPTRETPGNRFAGTLLGKLPIAIPRDYVQGIDCQRNDFEVGGRSYLHGRWEPRGWWYYYLVGLGIKTPLGTLAAIGMVALITVLQLNPKSKIENPKFADEVFLLTPAIAILALVSSQTGFSLHVRYAIPALPYLFIWCGKLAAEDHGGVGWDKIAQQSQAHQCHSSWAGARKLACPTLPLPRLRFGLVSLCVIVTAVESLAVYPHSISFFNLLIGGPAHGHEWLLDSNGAWGQDLVYLKEWVDRHPEARPLHLAAVGWLDPQALGIEYTIPPVGPTHHVTAEERLRMGTYARRAEKQTLRFSVSDPAEFHDLEVPQTWDDVRSLDDLGPQPGWYVIDVNHLHGTTWPANWPGWRFQKIAEDDLNYEYFRRFEPTNRVAYSYLVYHITADEANRVRHDLGLPSLRTNDD
jgi:hypothetical protein